MRPRPWVFILALSLPPARHSQENRAPTRARRGEVRLAMGDAVGEGRCGDVRQRRGQNRPAATPGGGSSAPGPAEGMAEAQRCPDGGFSPPWGVGASPERVQAWDGSPGQPRVALAGGGTPAEIQRLRDSPRLSGSERGRKGGREPP